MIRLDTVNRVLKLFLGGATTTNPLQIVVCYSDQTVSTYLGATQLSNSNGTTPVIICTAPAASTIRDIDMISVLNTDTAAANVTIEMVDTSTPYQIIYVQLQIGDKLTFTHGSGWQVVSDSGNIKYTVQSTGGVDSFNSRTGAVTLLSTDVTTALGYTPFNPTTTETAHYVYAGPTSGSAAAPTFRALVAADIPALSYAPQTSGTSILYGNGTGGFSNVTIGSGISFSAGTLSATGSGGTVTSVGLSLPSIFTVTGSPVTGSGTLTATLNSETANTFFAAPNGSAGTPTFRALVAADVPTLNQNTTGTAASVTGATQSAITSIPNLAIVGTITTGVWNGTPVSNSYLANSSITINGNSVSLGGSTTITAANPYALTIGTGLSGTSYNGASAVTIALANSGVTAGTYGSASVIPVLTINAQGQITSISTQATNAPSYQGTWNALTNTPTLTSSVGTQGYYYVVSVAGTTNLDGNAVWVVGDWAIFGNGKWERIPGSSSESFTNLTTTNLTVSGLTGYMYANGAGAVTASTTIPTTALSGTVTNAQLANSTISGVSLGSNLFNLTAGTNITFSSGTTYNGSAAITINAASTMVYPGAGIPNSTGSAWGTSYGTSGANSVVLRDSNQNVYANNFIPNTTTTTSSSTPINLTVASAQYQIVNGTTTSQTFNLPDATTLTVGDTFYFNNNITYSSIQINAHDGTTSILALQAGGAAHVILLTNGTSNGTWDVHSYIPGSVSWGNATLNFNTSSSISGSVSWQGNLIGLAYGGTNANLTAVAGGIHYSTSSATAISAAGTTGQILTSGGTGAPTWSAQSSLSVGTATNIAGGAAGSVPYQTGSGATSFLALGTSGYVLTAGASAPQYTAQSSLSVGTATNIAGGAANQIHYQTGSGATGFITAPSSSGTYLEWNGSSFVWATPAAGTGTVTSVAQSFTGGLISVSGSPITTSGTLALTVAGTSGGIPYFSSASTWASSAALTANALMIGGGAGSAPSTTTTGTGVLTALGVNTGSSGSFVVNGGALGTPSSGTLTNATGLPLSTGVTGTLPIANGGTGLTSTPSNGQIPIGNGTNYTASTLTAGSGISVTNASGSITVANTQNSGPFIRVYSSGNTSCAQNVATKIALNNAQYDTNSNFNTSTYRFTPTVGGYYQVNAVVAFLSYTASYVSLAIYKNGSSYSGFGSSYYAGTGIASFTTSDMVYLNGSTDYIELYVTQGTAGSLNANNAVMTAAMIRGT